MATKESIAIMRRPELHLVSKMYSRASKAQIIIDVAKGANTEA